MSLDNEDVLVQDELAALKSRADLMGITYHPSIGLEKLRAKVNAAAEGTDETDAEPATDDPKNKLVVVEAAVETESQKRKRLREEAAKLVRIRVTCMNPAKKEWDGEIFTCGNAGVGTFKKFVPFNLDAGYHVPNIIYQAMKDRQCQIFTTSKSKNGVTVRQGKLIKEFAIEVLPPLTEDELHDLAQRQAMARSID